MQEAWEGGGAPARRRWAPLVLVAVAVVVAGVVARPPGPAASPGGSGLEVRSDDHGAIEASPAPVSGAVVHALNTASLAERRDPLHVDLVGWGRLRTAVSERGRQLLALGRESTDGRDADLRILDAATLAPVAELGTVPGPLEQLAFTGDGRAVVWLRRTPDGPVVEHVPLAGGAPATVRLPRGLRVRELAGLREGRVAVAGTATRGHATAPLAVALVDVATSAVTEVPLDVPARMPQDDTPIITVEPALAWDTLRQVLHVAHPSQDRLTSVRLTDGAVVSSPVVHERPGLVRRVAALAVDGDAVVVTGVVTRANERGTTPSRYTVALEPIRFATDRPTLSFASGTPAALRTRGPAQPGTVVAAAAGRSVLASHGPAPDGGTATVVRLLDEDMSALGTPIGLPGEVVAARLDASGQQLRLASTTATGTDVRILSVPDGRVLAQRRYAPGAEVHLGAAVVVERR